MQAQARGWTLSIWAMSVYNVVRPDEASTWQLRVEITFLFPK